MSAAWKVALSQLSVESLKDLYARDVIAPDIQSLIGEVLAQKTLPVATSIATAIAVTVTNFVEATIRGSNSTTPPENPVPIDLAGTVSWQSAFWALATIALNSCLQDSGNICEIEARLGILVKSSPIFCAVDALIVWSQIFYYLRRVRPREALRIVARSRQEQGANLLEESKSVPLIIGRGLLLTIAIVQALKLYAFGGIPWTQVFGTMYLVSYATNALLNVLGKPRTGDNNQQADTRRGDIRPPVWLIHYFAIAAACVQILIWILVLQAALPEQWFTILEQARCRWPFDLITAIWMLPFWIVLGSWSMIFSTGAAVIDIVVMLLPSTLVLVVSNALIKLCLPSLPGIIAEAFSCSPTKMGYTVAALFILISAFIQVCFLPFPVFNAAFSNPNVGPIPQKVADAIVDLWDTFMEYSVAFFALAVVAMFSNFFHRVVFMGTMARKLKFIDLGVSSNLAWACLFMFLANISFAILYYSQIYTPQGTWKPSWTENLGRKIV